MPDNFCPFDQENKLEVAHTDVTIHMSLVKP